MRPFEPTFRSYSAWLRRPEVQGLDAHLLGIAVRLYQHLITQPQPGVTRQSIEGLAATVGAGPSELAALRKAGVILGAHRGETFPGLAVSRRSGPKRALIRRLILAEQPGPLWCIPDLADDADLHQAAREAGRRGGNPALATLKGCAHPLKGCAPAEAESRTGNSARGSFDRSPGALVTLKGCAHTLKGRQEPAENSGKSADPPTPWAGSCAGRLPPTPPLLGKLEECVGNSARGEPADLARTGPGTHTLGEAETQTLDAYRQAFAGRYGGEPLLPAAELAALRSIVTELDTADRGDAGPDTVRAYLRDSSPFLVKIRHRLRTLASQVNQYAPTRRSPLVEHRARPLSQDPARAAWLAMPAEARDRAVEDFLAERSYLRPDAQARIRAAPLEDCGFRAWLRQELRPAACGGG